MTTSTGTSIIFARNVQDRKAVLARQHEIQEHGVVGIGLSHVQAFLAVKGEVHGEIVLFEPFFRMRASFCSSSIIRIFIGPETLPIGRSAFYCIRDEEYFPPDVVAVQGMHVMTAPTWNDKNTGISTMPISCSSLTS